MLGYHQSTTSHVHNVEQLREAVSSLNHGLSFKYAESAELDFGYDGRSIFVGTFLKTRVAKSFPERLWLFLTKRKPHGFFLKIVVQKPEKTVFEFDLASNIAREYPDGRLVAEKSMTVWDPEHGKLATVIMLFEKKLTDYELPYRHLAGYDPKAA